MEGIKQKVKWGTVGEDGRVFVSRHRCGKEYWVSQEHFDMMKKSKQERERATYKSNTKRKNSALLFSRSSKGRNLRLKRAFGISLEDYEKKLSDQNGVCDICKKVCTSGRRLAVDHNHRSLKVRGLLCANCNRGIGYLKESPEIILNALKYLKNWNI
jgi:hypothetical protein